MPSANSTTANFKGIFVFFSLIFIHITASAQENSPYSRYGIGDLVPNKNIVSRGMGGIATGFTDNLNAFQSINISNPASLGSLGSTIFEVGGEIDFRTLKSNSSPERFTSVNTLISYLQLGFPIGSKKWKPGNAWGVSFGLRPLTRINYKIANSSRFSNIDSLETVYEGSGGVNQFNVSTGIKIQRFSFGVTGGYSFGNREYSTRLGFLNDSVTYYKSTTEAKTRFGGVFVNAGIQYMPKLEHGRLIVGASANFEQNLDAKRDRLNATFTYDGNGEISTIDTISAALQEKGTIKLPASYSVGFTYSNSHWLGGVDVDFTQWEKYRSYEAPDAVKNNIMIRGGLQYFPASATTPVTKYWNFVKYRAGFYYGNDYIKLDKNRPDYAITLGAGLPLSSLQRASYYGEFASINFGAELGQRGTKENQSIREGFARILIGVSLNAAWFQKRKYN